MSLFSVCFYTKNRSFERSQLHEQVKKKLQGDYLQFLMDLLLVKKYSILLSCTQSMGIQALHHHPFCITKTYWTALFPRITLQRDLVTSWIMPLISCLLFTETESVARIPGTRIILSTDTGAFQKATSRIFFPLYGINIRLQSQPFVNLSLTDLHIL